MTTSLAAHPRRGIAAYLSPRIHTADDAGDLRLQASNLEANRGQQRPTPRSESGTARVGGSRTEAHL